MAHPEIPRDAVPALKALIAAAGLACLGVRAASPASFPLDEAALAAEAGRHERALELLQRAAAARPKDADVRGALGWAALRVKRSTQAAAAFAEALKLDPKGEEAALGRARLALESGRHEEAARQLSALIKRRPESTLAHLYLGRARLALGRLREALWAFHGAYRSDPTYSEMRLQMGALHALLGRPNGAWREYAKVLQVDPKNKTARAEEARFAARRTRGAEEILPPQTISKPVPVVWSPALKAPVVRVALGAGSGGEPGRKRAFAFGADSAFEVRDPETGRQLAAGSAGAVWVARPAPAGGSEIVDAERRRVLLFRRTVAVRPLARTGSLVVRGLSLAQGTSWQSTGDRQLKGTLEIRPSRGAFYLVNALGLEDYLYGVVNGEMPAHFPREALKAQAVIARNHALYSRDALKPHKRWGYDLCDGQHCQVYRGAAGETPAGRDAVDETRGMVLRYRTGLAQTPYSANCGGHTQASGELSGWGKLDYLKGRPDREGAEAPRGPWALSRWLKQRPKAYCNVPKYMHSSHFRWARVISSKDLEERVRRRARIGRLKSVRVLKRSGSGNVNKIEFAGTEGKLVLEKEHVIRNIMGVASVRSTLFVIETELGPSGLPSEFYLYGGGWGHGVGLCQCGAAGRADAGQGFRMILGHYYPGTYLKSLGY